MRPTDPDQVVPTTYLEHALKLETRRLAKTKMLDLLGYIPGVQVGGLGPGRRDPAKLAGRPGLPPRRARARRTSSHAKPVAARTRALGVARRRARCPFQPDRRHQPRQRPRPGRVTKRPNDESEFEAFAGFKHRGHRRTHEAWRPTSRSGINVPQRVRRGPARRPPRRRVRSPRRSRRMKRSTAKFPEIERDDPRRGRAARADDDRVVQGLADERSSIRRSRSR